jgi:hypothetical protein
LELRERTPLLEEDERSDGSQVSPAEALLFQDELVFVVPHDPIYL